MKKSVIGLIIVLALIVIMIGGYINNEIEAEKEISEAALGYEVDLENAAFGISKGQMAPDFTLQTLSGETLTLSELRGKKVLLNFWATWCPPCKKEMPHLQTYYDQYADEDNVEIVAVNLKYTDGSIGNIQTYVDSFGLTFPIPLMEEDKITNQYQVLSIPSTFFIDTEGRIQQQIIGPLDENSVREYVSQLN